MPTLAKPQPAPWQTLLAGLGRVWRQHRIDIAIVAALSLLTLFVRLLTLQHIENGGDPLDNWFFVKLLRNNGLPIEGYLNHHNGRFGIHWITWMVQTLVGTRSVHYFIAPLLASHLCSILVYVVGRMAVSRAVGVVGTLLLLEFNPFVFASSQLRPGIFEAMYVVGATACLIRYVKRGERTGTGALIGTGVLLFLGYLTKLPVLFCAPGIVVVIFLAGGGVRGALIFCTTLAAGLFLETVGYLLFTDYSHRIAVVMNAHGRHATRPHNIWYLFTRFTTARDSWKLAYYFFFASGLTVLGSKRPLVQKAPVIVATSFLLFATFGIRGWNPIRLWMSMNDRYLTLAIPLVMIVNAGVLVEAGRGLATWALSPFIRRRPRLLTVVGALVLSLWFCAVGTKIWVARGHKGLVSIQKTRRMNSLISDAYARQLPIVGKVTKRKTATRKYTQVRALHWAVKGFVDEELMLDAEGHLPKFSYITSMGQAQKNHRYVPKTPQLTSKKVRQGAKNDPDCIIFLKNKGMNVLTRHKTWKLAERCGPPA